MFSDSRIISFGKVMVKWWFLKVYKDKIVCICSISLLKHLMWPFNSSDEDHAEQKTSDMSFPNPTESSDHRIILSQYESYIY